MPVQSEKLRFTDDKTTQFSNLRNRKKPTWLILILLTAGLIAWVYCSASSNSKKPFNRATNGLWMQHAWLGADSWFRQNNKPKGYEDHFRKTETLRNLAIIMHEHDISDLYPHLAPTSRSGFIPAVDPIQTRKFLKIMHRFRIMPWVGGVTGKQVFLEDENWRHNFATSIKKLLTSYPSFSGIHINIEPNSSGNKQFLSLLERIKSQMPTDKILSVAAFPPPFFLQPYPELHWDKNYYKEIASRVDQMVIMSYNTALPLASTYRWLMAAWTKEAIEWSGKTPVLIGIPSYDDSWASYHDPKVENLKNALEGVKSGLAQFSNIPKNYQGVAIYSGWEMTANEWSYFKQQLSDFEN